MSGGQQALIDARLQAMNKDNASISIPNVNGNFGKKKEFYCLYLQSYTFKPWNSKNTITFNPFRNVQINSPSGNGTERNVGNYNSWLLEPPFTHQTYTDGSPCPGETRKATTRVTYVCGTENGISSFKEVKKCVSYELIFSTPLKCAPDDLRLANKAAIKKYGKETFVYMWVLFGALIFCIWYCYCCCCCVLLRRRRKRRRRRTKKNGKKGKDDSSEDSDYGFFI